MKSIYYKILVLTLIVSFFPIQASGIIDPQFGGYVLAVTPCTCTPGTFLITYKPLHIEGSPLPLLLGFLTMSGTVIKNSYAQFVYPPAPTAWHLGEISLGSQCLVGVAPDCISIPAFGRVKKSGSSYPGWPIPII